MSNRRQFIGAGVAVTASSLAGTANAKNVAEGAGMPGRRLFVYQLSAPDAMEAGRVMAGRGVTVFGLDGSNLNELELTLSEFWAHGPVPVVGLTDEAGFRYAQALARRHGVAQVHSAQSEGRALIHWVLDPS
jgi:hypothetical protein